MLPLLCSFVDVDACFNHARAKSERRITYTQFIDALSALSCRKCPGKTESQALQSIMKRFILPLRAKLQSDLENRSSAGFPAQLGVDIPDCTSKSEVIVDEILITERPLPSRSLSSPPRSARTRLGVASGTWSSPSRWRESVAVVSGTQENAALFEKCRIADEHVAQLKQELANSSVLRQADAQKSAKILRAVAFEADARLENAKRLHEAELVKVRQEEALLRSQLQTALDTVISNNADHAVALAALDAKRAAAETECHAALLSARAADERVLQSEQHAASLSASLQALLVDSMQATLESRGSWDSILANFSAKLKESECARIVAERRADATEKDAAEKISSAIEMAVTLLNAELATTSDLHFQAESRSSLAAVQFAALEQKFAEVVSSLRAEIDEREKSSNAKSSDLVEAENRTGALLLEVDSLKQLLNECRAREATLNSELMRHIDLLATAQMECSALKEESSSRDSELQRKLRDVETNCTNQSDILVSAELTKQALVAELEECHAELIESSRENQELVAKLKLLVEASSDRETDFEGELEALHLASIAARAQNDDAAVAQLSSQLRISEEARKSSDARVHLLEHEILKLHELLVEQHIDRGARDLL